MAPTKWSEHGGSSVQTFTARSMIADAVAVEGPLGGEKIIIEGAEAEDVAGGGAAVGVTELFGRAPGRRADDRRFLGRLSGRYGDRRSQDAFPGIRCFA